MKKILLAISVLLLTVSAGYGEGVPVKVTIEPVNARTEEIGVYIFGEDEPFKIKVTLENTSNRKLTLLTPGMQNHYDKVFCFQILDLNGNIIRADERGTFMTHAETIGPEKITLMPKESHSFYAYLNSNKGGIEHHHFFGLNLFSKLFQDRYYFVKGVYDTTKYSKLDTPGNYYHDIDEVIAYSNDIRVEIVKKNETKPLQLTIKSDKEVYEVGEEITLGLSIKNLGSKEIVVPELVGSSKIVMDGREYSRPPIFIWNGIGELLPGTEWTTTIMLSTYGITKDILELGKHDISVQIGDVISNTITIEVVEKKKTDLPNSLSFLSDVPEFQEFRFQMTEQEIREIVRKNPLILEGNSQKGFFVTNKDGETLALPMVNGRCSGIQRLPKQPRPILLTIKSNKQVYEAGEPIILTTTLKNTSRHDYTYLIPDVYDNNVRFWSVETKKGQLERIRPYSQGHLRKDNYTVIRSNDSINYNSDVTTIWKFPAGTYKIKANYKGENWYSREDNSIAEMEDCFTGTLTSNPITIEVVEKNQPLQLTIKSDKQVYEVGEKYITIKFTMKNLGSQQIKPYYVLEGSVIILNNKEYRLPIVWRGNSEGYIHPGAEYIHSLNLKADWQIKEQFNKPGILSITWRYDTLTSNTITIEVAEQHN